MKKSNFLNFQFILFSIIFTLGDTVSYAQKSIDYLTDKEQIGQYLTELNNQKFEEEGYEEKYYTSEIVYSPDSLFKIFTFSGDAYFAYFTSISKSYIHILNKKGQTIKIIENDFDEIKGIYKISKSEDDESKENNYLILENRESKISSVNYISYMIATWLVLDTESHSIHFNQIDKEKQDDKLTYSTQEYDLDFTLESDASYNSENNQLFFEYSLIEDNELEPSHFMRITYEWKNGIFILLKEEKLAYEE